MIADILRDRPFPLTVGGILVGTALIATNSSFLPAVGAALIVAGMLVPLIRFVAISYQQAAYLVEHDDLSLDKWWSGE